MRSHFVNLHRHDQFSLADGFGTAKQSVEEAVRLGQGALGLSNHGNLCGVVEHWKACREAGIVPVIGVEAYFQPKFDKERRPFHLCLYATSLEGYSNISVAMSEAAEDTFFRRPILTWNSLRQHNRGIIATSACIGGFPGRLIMAGHFDLAERAVREMANLFGRDRYFVEVMPVEVGGMQSWVNKALIRIAKRVGVRVVLTVDSHYGGQRDWTSWQMAQQFHKRSLRADYSQRRMITGKEAKAWWAVLHPTINPSSFIQATVDIAEECGGVDLAALAQGVPLRDWGMPSYEMLKRVAEAGLRRLKGTGLTQEYKQRLAYELRLVKEKGFEDYFLLVWDCTNWARQEGIGVGFGRGSVCGSLLAWSLGLTGVDPILLGTDFERFLRPDRTTLPDIDLDFDSRRRGEVQAYLMRAYEAQAAPIATFGYYRGRNLINDLGKAYKMGKEDLDGFKTRIDEVLLEQANLLEPVENLKQDRGLRALNIRFPGVLQHFERLYGQVRYVGRHPAGIALTARPINEVVPLMRVKDALQTSFDMNSINDVGVLKVDILGLDAVCLIEDLAQETGERFDYSDLRDKRVWREFRAGNTAGVFQFERGGAQEILRKVKPKGIQDLIAALALNRPAPIKFGTLDAYLEARHGGALQEPWSQFCRDTHGVPVYQEHVMRICRGMAEMEWGDIDKVMKAIGNKRRIAGVGDEIQDKWMDGAKRIGGLKRDEAERLYGLMTCYLFNKGHAAGYALLTFWSMCLKLRHPLEFWRTMLREEKTEQKREGYKAEAVRAGVVVLLPHVNGSASYSITDLDGERVLQEGMAQVKGVGLKTALAVEAERAANGQYIDRADVEHRLSRRLCNSRALTALQEAGAFEFNQEAYLNRVVRYNSGLLASAERKAVG